MAVWVCVGAGNQVTQTVSGGQDDYYQNAAMSACLGLHMGGNNH